MTCRRFKPAFPILLALLLASAFHAQAPGECTAQGGTTAKCCEHEAYWCHGGNNQALAHCEQCHKECLKISTTSVCVWGGTWPSRYQKCYNGLEWYKVCFSIPNDRSLTGGAWKDVDRSIVSPSTEAPGKRIEEVPMKLEVATRTASTIVSHAKGAGKLSTSNREIRSEVQNKIAILLSLMGQVVVSLRSALISNTVTAVRDNMGRAVSHLQYLETQARELIPLISAGNRGVFDLVISKWIGAVRVIRSLLQGYIAQGQTVEALKQNTQGILDELTNGFWTRAQVALDGYIAAGGTFTKDWAPWAGAIWAYFNP